MITHTHTQQFAGIIKVTAVNCNAQKKICDEYGVKEFPTLKVSFAPHLRSPTPSLSRPFLAPASLGAHWESVRHPHLCARQATTQ
jgi:hypothetical protein